MIASKHDKCLSALLVLKYCALSLSLALYLYLIHHRHTLLGYTHFNVQMSWIRVGSHQRFYAFDITNTRCNHQRRLIAGGLGGRMGGWGMVGEDRGRELLVYCGVLHVCVYGKAQRRRIIKKRRNK